jgi:hypothetical protein
MQVSDRQQRERERVPPSVINYLEEKLEPVLKHKTRRNHALSTRQQVKAQMI